VSEMELARKIGEIWEKAKEEYPQFVEEEDRLPPPLKEDLFVWYDKEFLQRFDRDFALKVLKVIKSVEGMQAGGAIVEIFRGERNLRGELK